MPRLKAGPASSGSKPPATASPSPSLNAFRRAEYQAAAEHENGREAGNGHAHEHEHEDGNGEQQARPARAPRGSHAGSGSRESRKSSRVLNCENCREKKMRCDRTNPCSPCALRNVECKWAVEPPDVSAAPSPLRQNAGEIARLRREIKALALQLGLSSAELDAVEDDAERFVRSQDPSPSPSVSTSQPSSATPKPPPRKRPSIPKPLAAPVVPAPAPAPRAPSPPEQQDPEQQPEPDASYYKRGFSTAGWGSWDRKEPTWAAAPPGPRRYEPTPGWAAPAAGGPAYEFQPPPQAGLQPSFQRAYGPGEDVRPHGYHAYAMSPPGFAQPPKPLSPVVPHPHSPALHPHSPSLPSLASVVDEIEQQAEVDLPPIRRSPPGSGEKRPSVALPSIGAWFAPGHEGERMEE